MICIPIYPVIQTTELRFLLGRVADVALEAERVGSSFSDSGVVWVSGFEWDPFCKLNCDKIKR